ncbi:unnamed protein product [Rotaria magnacalcarata]|uniref:Uncharacterized protein n=1 Tax=Rotaria magnacalcarata TaxID=392030 RepID=A0A819BYA7_9BILA|nr:unnamed protein product [Rotaria magnacalcarata]CAF3805459.1 unnamed protein product [Rotaria magnacalcarata]
MASVGVENKNKEHITTAVDEISSMIEPESVHDHSHSCNDPTHNHEKPLRFDQSDLYSSLTGAKNETSAKRKHKKPKKQTVILAEAIPGNRGNENIDDLVNFINGPSSTNDKKQKKKSASTN